MDENLKNEVKFRIAMQKINDEKNNNIKGHFNKKSIIAACAILLLSTGGVFAKDIDNYIKQVFNNSSKAIDIAVDNGYVQETKMDYIYDKDIGIKVDNLILDDLNLDISFNFEAKKENLKSIRLNDFIITNDKNKVIFRSEFKTAESPDNLPLYNSVNWAKEPIKLTDTTFKDSILLGLRSEKEDFKELYFDINKLDILYTDGSRKILEGNWNFTVTINDDMRKAPTVVYNMIEDNEYVESCTATMSNTGLLIELHTKEKIPIDNPDIFLIDMLYLSNNQKIYKDFWIDFNDEIMIIHCDDINNFIENSDKLELHLEFFNTIIVLTKKII